MLYEELLKHKPFELDKKEKDKLLKASLKESLEHHFQNSKEYQKYCKKKVFLPPFDNINYEDIPFFPVDIFKNFHLSSVPENSLVRTLNSSATTSQTPSSIYLDDITRKRQVKTLIWLLSDFIGKERIPFLIFDADPRKNNLDKKISARNAAIRGFLIAASQSEYFMNVRTKDELTVDIPKLINFLTEVEKQNTKTILFGFTYVLFSHVAKQLQRQNIKFNLTNSLIIHIGGWKKLQSEAVSKNVFNNTLSAVFGVRANNILDSYGFTEQLGIIYIDCEDGLKRCPLVSEIIIRDPGTLEQLPDGEPGLVEFISPLPFSYPGCAVLLDDIGRVVTRNSDSLGRNGTAYEILGRAKEAEVRGCGDIMAEKIISEEG